MRNVLGRRGDGIAQRYFAGGSPAAESRQRPVIDKSTLGGNFV
jgi:hypothetical protein